MGGLSSLVYCLQLMPGTTQLKHISGSPPWVGLLALPANIRLGQKGLPRDKQSSLL